MPDATIGDINAQFAANAIGAKRLGALATKYGADRLEDAMQEMLNYSERRIRAAIRDLPDGQFEAEATIDDDGVGDTAVIIRTQVEIAGEQVTVRFDGTDRQVSSFMNNPFASTVASAVACVKSVLTDRTSPSTTVSRASSKSTHRWAPYSIPTTGSGARAPAAIQPRVQRRHEGAGPSRTGSGHCRRFDTTTSVCLSHLGERGYNIYLEILGGGYGAGVENDGCDGVDCPLSNCANIPIEALEMDYPFLRVETYRLRPGSGGAGANRGGHGLERSYRILSDDVAFATYSDRFRHPASGLFGGSSGRTAEVVLERNGEEIRLPSKTAVKLGAGELLSVRTGGGGGYGGPQNA